MFNIIATRTFTPNILRTNLVRTLATKNSKIYNFEDIKQLVQNPQPQNKLLVDVREPEELKSCCIPTAINIPLNTSPGALGLNADEFKEIFNFEKPSINKELIFFCEKGIRAKTAEELARSYGYENTGVYTGSMSDWVAKGGKEIVPKTK